MSCPIPIRIINPHYRKIASLSAIDVSQFEGRDDYYLDVPCGVCYHCRKSYKSQWNIRLQHHFKYLTKQQKQNSYFCTLTFDDEHLPTPSDKDHTAPLVRKFLERIRKHCRKSVNHWIVSEYGDTTCRFHLHALLFDIPFPIHELQRYWKYGFVSYRRLTEKRITYVTSYVNKQIKGLIELPHLRQFVLTSPGIGKSYTNDPINILYARQHGSCVPFIYHSTKPVAMPRYYRHKIFTDDELEDIKESYFHFRSDDVIPDPPYILGTTNYIDYTDYLAACEQLRKQKNRIYYKYKTISNYEQSEFEPPQ